jgi:hypothetical protein
MRRNRRVHGKRERTSVARVVNGDATRRLQVVRVATSGPDAGPPERAGARTSVRVCARALRSCALYLGNGLRLLGQHFSAGAWCDELDDPRRDERGRGA